MADKFTGDLAQANDLANALRSWVMVALTFIFLLLYGAALLGWLTPNIDEKIVTRIEPIIFIIIGYYLGRLPSQQNEGTLKVEISRQAQRADAAQHAKEQAQQAREALEEKLKNVRTALVPSLSMGSRGAAEKPGGAGGIFKDDSVGQSVSAAINILNS